MTPSRAVLCWVALVVWTGRPAEAQQPDTIPDPDAPGNCTLMWEPVDPDAVLLGAREDAEAFISRFSGRMLFTCGSATMEADSTVKYDRLRKIDFVGNVRYRDTIRTLNSEFLTYFEIQDLVVARDSVVLVRTVDGSRLRGPSVEFLRAVSGVDALTTATGRPHMTFYPEGDEPQEPFEIDSDRASFAGENEARFHGDVIMKRSDLDAAADSAYLLREEEVGVMWGRPWVETEEIRLEGDTIRFRSEGEELREVHAEGDALAHGQQFEVRAELIDAELAGEEVEKVWAHGEGLSEALSGGQELYGDSMRFVLHQSQIDTVFSVGGATAIQRDSAGADPLLVEGLSAADSALAADTLATALDSVPGAAADSVRSAGSDSVPSVSDPFTVPDPAAVEDSLEVIAPDPGAPDTTRTPPPDSAGVAQSPVPGGDPDEQEASLMESVLASVAPGDSMMAPPGDTTQVEPASGPLPGTPFLSVDGSTNWVNGDTVIAIFERPGRPPPDSLPPDSLAAAAADSLLAAIAGPAADSLLAAVAGPAGDSLLALEPRAPDPGDPAETAPDSTGDPRIERLIAIVNARSFYRQVRDTAATDRPSRNYMIGSRIEIVFEEGEPRRVFGENAIGIYLEPEEAIPQGGETAPDSAGAASDSLGVVPDSLRAPGDTTGVGTDSSRVAPDSLRVDPDTLSAPPDTSSRVRPGRSIPSPGRRGVPQEHARRSR